jgi:hypothetical protein
VSAESDIVETVHNTRKPGTSETSFTPRAFSDEINSTQKVSCSSPTGALDPFHLRTISTSTISTVSSVSKVQSDLEDLKLGSLTVDLDGPACDSECVSGRSFDSWAISTPRDRADAFIRVDEFDALLAASLPEIRVRHAFSGNKRRSSKLLQEFTFECPHVPHKAQTKPRVVFESNEASENQRVESTGRVTGRSFGSELKRMISRFKLSKIGGGNHEATSRDESSKDGTVKTAIHESTSLPGPAAKQYPRSTVVRTSRVARDVDFVVMIPPNKSSC